MKLKQIHIIGMLAGILIIAASFFFIGTQYFFLIIGVGILACASPFIITLIIESQEEGEKEMMFLEFTRNLVESVKTGTPISKSIINSKNKSYGVLTAHVNKLANQISMGIPLSVALETFAKDLNNKKISRIVILIGQAEKAGGDIGEILEAVAEAVTMSDKLKKERMAAISSLVVQGYIIFVVFLIIVLVMQFKIIPMIEGITDIGMTGITSSNSSGGELNKSEIANSFIWLLIVQGFFSGLAIGKLAEGNIKAGIKHSFALVLLAFFVSSFANIII